MLLDSLLQRVFLSRNTIFHPCPFKLKVPEDVLSVVTNQERPINTRTIHLRCKQVPRVFVPRGSKDWRASRIDLKRKYAIYQMAFGVDDHRPAPCAPAGADRMPVEAP